MRYAQPYVLCLPGEDDAESKVEDIVDAPIQNNERVEGRGAAAGRENRQVLSEIMSRSLHESKQSNHDNEIYTHPSTPRSLVLTELMWNKERRTIVTDVSKNKARAISSVSFNMFPRFKQWCSTMDSYSGPDSQTLHANVLENRKLAAEIANAIFEDISSRFGKRNRRVWKLMLGGSVFNPMNYDFFAREPDLAIELLADLLKEFPVLASVGDDVTVTSILLECRSYFTHTKTGYGTPLRLYTPGRKKCKDDRITPYYHSLQKVYQQLFYNFAEVAFNVLSFLGTTVLIESTFSITNLIKNKSRTLLHPDKVDAFRRLKTFTSFKEMVSGDMKDIMARFRPLLDHPNVKSVLQVRSKSKYYGKRTIGKSATLSQAERDSFTAEVKQTLSMSETVLNVAASVNGERRAGGCAAAITDYFNSSPPARELKEDCAPDEKIVGENDILENPESKNAQEDAESELRIEMEDAKSLNLNDCDIIGWHIRFFDEVGAKWCSGCIQKRIGDSGMRYEIKIENPLASNSSHRSGSRPRRSSRNRAMVRIVDLAVTRYMPAHQ